MNGDFGGTRISGWERVDELEARLAAALYPVQPESKFVKDLKRRLMASTHALDIEHPRSIGAPAFVVGASLVSGTFLMVLAIRGLRHWRSGMGIQRAVEKEETAAA